MLATLPAEYPSRTEAILSAKLAPAVQALKPHERAMLFAQGCGARGLCPRLPLNFDMLPNESRRTVIDLLSWKNDISRPGVLQLLLQSENLTQLYHMMCTYCTPFDSDPDANYTICSHLGSRLALLPVQEPDITACDNNEWAYLEWQRP